MTVYDKKGAAKALCISTATLDRYCAGRKLPSRKIGDRVVFTESDLTAFLNACAVPAQTPPTDREAGAMRKAAGGVA